MELMPKEKNMYSRVVIYLLWLGQKTEMHIVLYSVHLQRLSCRTSRKSLTIPNVIMYRLQVRNFRSKEIKELDQVHRDS